MVSGKCENIFLIINEACRIFNSDFRIIVNS